MSLSRRSFLQTVGIGAAAGAALQFPFSEVAIAAEPRRVTKTGGPVLLNSNENPYGPPTNVRQAMQQALEVGNRYPDKQYDGLIDRIATLHRVQPHQVLTGCGSTELLRMCAETFLAPGKKLIMPAPTFEAIGQYAKSYGAEVVMVPLTANYAHDLDAMLARTDANTGLVYICNPNNPTASLTPRKDLEAFISKLPRTVYVLMDEAYHHFATDAAEYTSFLDKPIDDPRLSVARTFSKIYRMAGLRLGCAAA